MTTNNPIDAIGHLDAQIAALQAQRALLRDAIIEMGEGAHEGNTFRVTVSVCERGTLDMKAVRAKLSPQFIVAHTTYTTVTTVKVGARKVEA